MTDIAGQIIRYGRVVNSRRASLAVSIADTPTRSGALIVTVQPNGPAAEAGLTAGDAIINLNGTGIADASASRPHSPTTDPATKSPSPSRTPT